MKFECICRPFLLTSVAILGLASISFATPTQGIADSYGDATHANETWQEIGNDGIAGNPTSTDTGILSDLGVFWSVDNGMTWGRSDLTVGQTVKFQVKMHQNSAGSHYANFMKLWVDNDQSGTFEESSEVANYAKNVLRETKDGNLVSGAMGDIIYETEEGLFIGDEFLDKGFLSLRARVTCSESLIYSSTGNWDWNKQWDSSWTGTDSDKYESAFLSKGWLNQGESEDWTINIGPAAVPEPTTMLLFGTGIAGLAAVGRKKRK